jgi:serine/threonine protein kinase
VALTPGARIGVYEVIAPLGAGGMGEVYRAHDGKLGRDVAVKILPDAFAGDPERLARFEREARVLASLNHPHIASIYGVEEAALSTGSGQMVKALILELVEGPTLAERLRHGPLPVSEAVALARQIAEALETAHEKGIVHRDLKPANIKLTPAGAVKVLDFGIAKIREASGEDAVTDVSTVTTIGTRLGVVLGTAAYMSPEQARGQAVDKRTDIWAFGCVLYEMLTGRAVFARDTAHDTLAAILERAPDWSALPAETPEALHRILVRALEKNQRRRLRDIGDANLDLQAAIAGPDSPSRATVPKPRRQAGPWHVAALLAALAAGAIGGVVWRDSTPPRSLAVGPLTRLTFDSGLTTQPSISADGRLVAYASDRSGAGNLDIWVQQTTGESAIRLTSDPANDQNPDVSPDGNLIAFQSERSPRGVYVVPALGGDARLVAPDGMVPRFSPDGRSIAFWTGPWMSRRAVSSVRRTYVVASTGGDAVQVASTLASAGDPVWSPDGRALVLFGRQAASGEGTDPDWWWAPVDGEAPVPSGAYKRLVAGALQIQSADSAAYPLAWAGDGVLFSAAGPGSESENIWSISIDSRTGAVAGDPVRLTGGTTLDLWPSASRDGRMVFAATNRRPGIFALPLDANTGRPTGPLRRLREDAARTGRPGASEDGRLLVFSRAEFDASGVWIRDLSTGRERQLVATQPAWLNTVISSDGRWVAYTETAVNRGGGGGPGTGYVVEVAHGAPRRACDDCEVSQFTRDNRQLVITEQGSRVVSRVDLGTGSRTPLITGSRVSRPLLAPPHGSSALTPCSSAVIWRSTMS